MSEETAPILALKKMGEAAKDAGRVLKEWKIRFYRSAKRASKRMRAIDYRLVK